MIIGFAGKAASGKTTAAMHLKNILAGNVLILPMALVLRDEVETFLHHCGAGEHVPLVYGSQDDKVRVFQVDTARALAACRQWEGFIAENRKIQQRPGTTAVTVRRLLQWWGTEYRRTQDPDYWTKAWGRKVEQCDSARARILVDDVRFMNEVAVIRSHGGLLVKIERPGFLGANNHSSETSLDDYHAWDAVVQNDGTFAEFMAKIEQLAAAWGFAPPSHAGGGKGAGLTRKAGRMNIEAGMPIEITLDAGTYFRCTCGRSQHLPFCDESHRGGDSLPLRFEIDERRKVYLCSCGETANAPYCDGSCGFTPP